MMFAITAPILAFGLAAALDFSNLVSEEQRAQAAADSAALVATTAVVNSTTAGSPITAAQAEALAQQYFDANAPAAVVAAQVSFSATTSVSSSNLVTTAVSFSSKPPSMLGGLAGGPTGNFSVAATSSAQVTTTTTTPSGNLTGSGWAAEDPVIQGANGVRFMDMCDPTHVTWYNLLSDTGFEVNANCDGTPYWAELYQFTVLAGAHTVSVTPVLQPVYWPGYGNINLEVWYGAVTVDGVAYASPTVAGATTLLSDASNKITVKNVIGQPKVSGSASNYVLITTSTYSVTIAYDSDDNGSYNLGFADMQIAATNAGACGAPGGLWGQTLGTGSDSNAADFTVSGATATASQFSKTCATTVSTGSISRLTQ